MSVYYNQLKSIMANTYNLHLAIVQTDNFSQHCDQGWNEIIHKTLTQEITHVIEWNGQMVAIPIKWEHRNLDKAQQLVQGEYFAQPFTNCEELILEHTTRTIQNLEKKLGMTSCGFKIVFNVSRVLGKRSVIPDSYGVL